jgi:hypothetical protein
MKVKNYSTNIVHEYRAATDASVKLLAEMEEKALERILQSVRLDCNDLKMVLHHMKDPINLENNYLMQMNINGKRKELKICLDCTYEKGDIIDQIIKSLSEMIAVEMLSGVYKQLYETLKI